MTNTDTLRADGSNPTLPSHFICERCGAHLPVGAACMLPASIEHDSCWDHLLDAPKTKNEKREQKRLLDEWHMHVDRIVYLIDRVDSDGAVRISGTKPHPYCASCANVVRLVIDGWRYRYDRDAREKYVPPIGLPTNLRSELVTRMHGEVPSCSCVIRWNEWQWRTPWWDTYGMNLTQQEYAKKAWSRSLEFAVNGSPSQDRLRPDDSPTHWVLVCF